jgi:UDP-N-acetylmuramate dehydrogenase
MFPQVPHLENEPLARYTSYRIGGPARHLALPKTREHIEALGAYLKATKEPYFILGNGSNVLAPDEGFPGTVICTKDLEPLLEFLPDNKVRASAGTLNSRILRASAEMGLGGIDSLSGVPGNIGGAVFMNAGTGKHWIEHAVLEVETVNLNGPRRTLTDLRFSYREQHFLKPTELIFAVTFQLKVDPEVKTRLAEAIKKRKAAQPIELPSCGSVFRNPEGTSSWKCLDSAGLRGLKQGGAQVSPKHSNFIVNNGGATRADVLFLIETAQKKVKDEQGIELHREVILMEPKVLE